ncbi:MAG TPA: GNAT family N-acetyltransferase [Conexibacter sp.]|nr:GNAT family N-acetyltransferase [Conexibacter sp.]
METLGSPADLRRAAAGWEALAAAAATLPTQEAAWAIAGAEAFGDAHVLVHGELAAPEAIAPLARRGRRLELLGLPQLYEPADVLAGSEAALDALAERLVRERLPLALGRIPAEAPIVAALRRALGRRGVLRVAEAPGHPALTLTEVWQEPGGGLSSSRRSALRRARRKAEQAGEVTIELHAPTPEQVEALLEEAIDVEGRSWKARTGTALAASPQLARFYRVYGAEAAARGQLRVELLRIDGRAVAMQLGVEWRQRIWLLKIGFDEAHAAASPGQVLLGESIADAARRGLEGYELLGSAAPWTDVWAPELRTCVRAIAYPAGAASGIALSGAAARAARAAAAAQARATLRAAERGAARRYVAGPALADGLREQRRYAAAGYDTVLGYWPAGDTPVADARAENVAAADALAAGVQLAIKPPAMGNDAKAIGELMAHAAARGVPLHFDALTPATAEPVLRLAAQLAPDADGTLGCTLPGRWRRSVADAELAIEHGLRVRIVKSEWADPDDPARDPRAGYLAVVDALAGRATRVEVATQDAELAGEALRRLQAAGTPCELQVLHAMRCGDALAAARALGVSVRVYVPYGNGRLPYEIDAPHRHPQRLARLLADVAGVRPGAGPPT